MLRQQGEGGTQGRVGKNRKEVGGGGWHRGGGNVGIHTSHYDG